MVSQTRPPRAADRCSASLFTPRPALLLACLLVTSTLLAQSQPRLTPLPPVSTDSMEKAVREQLESQLAALEDIANNTSGHGPTASEQQQLATAYGQLGQLYLIYDLGGPAKIALKNATALAPNEPRWHYLLGTLFELDAEHEAAANSYQRALTLAIEAGAPAALVLPIRARLARVLLQLHRYSEARPLFESLTNAEDFRAFGMYGLGRIAADSGDHSEAVKELAGALAAQPEANQIHYQLALSYRAMGKLDQARFHLANRGDGTVSFPDPIVMEVQGQVGGAGAMLTLGRISLATGQTEIAEQRFLRAIEINPKSSAAYEALGNLYRHRGDQEAALTSFEKAIALSPDDAGLRFSLAQMLVDGTDSQPTSIRKSTLEQAVGHLEEALLLAPDFLAGRVLLAQTLTSLGRYEQADALYAEGIERRPRAFDLHLLRAQSLADRIAHAAPTRASQIDIWGAEGRAEVAEFLAGLADSGKPLATVAELDLGLLQLRLGDSILGRQRLRTLLDSDQTPAQIAATAAFYLANEAAQQATLLASGTAANAAVEEALHDYRKALTLAPQLAEARFNLATLLGRLGRFGEAAENYGRLVASDPNNQAVRFSHAMALVLDNQHARAKAALEQALEVIPDAANVAHLLTRLLVTSPDNSVRDAAVGLDLAFRLFNALPTPEHGETVAMALAESGHFDKALEWQQRVIDELESAGLDTTVARKRLELYKTRTPVRSPWRDN